MESKITQDYGPFYHGTKADLKTGDLLEPNYNSNYGEGKKANYVYLTATLDAEVIAQGSIILLGLMWSLPVYGAQMVGAVTVQAMGKAKASFLLSFARQGFFYIPLLFILHKMAGLKGLILAQPLADFLALVLSIAVLTIIIKQANDNVQKTAV